MLTLSQAKDAVKQIDRNELEKLIDQYSEEVIEAALELGISLESVEEAYQGEYRSDVDFAQNLAEDLGAVDKNASWPNNCIDWEKAASELMYDYTEEDGHYFRNL